jgi:hypothetical protein
MNTTLMNMLIALAGGAGTYLMLLGVSHLHAHRR